MKIFLSPLVLLFAVYATAQSPEEYPGNSVKLQSHPIVLNENVEFFSADIINVLLATNLGDMHNDAQIAGMYILKDETGISFFENMQELYNSPEFRKAFHTKIETYEDAARLSSFFHSLYNGLSFGYYFSIAGKWYFTTSDGGFFGADGFVITCSENGVIENVEMKYDLKFEMPGEAKRNEDKLYQDLTGFSIPANVEEKVMMKFNEKVDYSLSTSPALEFSLGNIEVLNGELMVTEKFSDMESVGTYPFLIIKNGDEYIPVAGKDDLLENDLYYDELKSKFALRTDADARNFRSFLDKLSDAGPEVKSHKKIAGNAWFFANSTSFDDTLGVLVLTDENGKINAIASNSLATKENILRLKMKDPDFKVDYEFKLVYPSETEIETTNDKDIEIEISFNEDLVNASDGWIATMANGKPVGILAASDGLTSPFGDKFPASYLGKGTHTVEYVLMKPGDDYENPLSKITIMITVK
ncbi:hypothetical protein [Lentimicrobium sp.]|uniref:hypothetical protein n=1 Tax=Lentimicrobium sp. TaxID=2034841 RepID=UPI00345E449B